MGSQGNMRGKRDQAGVTEHQFGTDGWAGGGTLGATAVNVDVGFLQYMKLTRSIHPALRGICSLGDGGGEYALGRSCGGIEEVDKVSG